MKSSSLAVKTMLKIIALVLACLLQNCSGGGFNCDSSTETLFLCPNCGGINVTDCLRSCDGYLFQATQDGHNFCFDRTLFSPHSDTPYDFDGYYVYLWQNAVAGVIWFIIAGLAISSGVGGGAIFLPLGIILLRFSPSSASGLSQASIFGAAVGGLLLNVQNLHPYEKIRNEEGSCPPSGKNVTETRPLFLESISPIKVQEHLDETDPDGTQKNRLYSRPLIPYDMLLMLSPMEIAGATTGVMIQTLFPNWLYLSCAAIVLSLTGYLTFDKFRKLRVEETERFVANAARTAADVAAAKTELDNPDIATSNTGDDKFLEEEAQPITNEKDEVIESTVRFEAFTSKHSMNNGNSRAEMGATHNAVDIDVESKIQDAGTLDDIILVADGKGEDEETSAALRLQFLEEDMVQYPRRKLFLFLLLWCVLTLLTFLKGGKGFESLIGISCESALYTILTVIQYVWLVGFAIFFGVKNLKDQKRRINVGYPLLVGDPIWTGRELAKMSFAAFGAGLVGGFIGISGGNFLNPFLLTRNIHPLVASATTASMIVLTSSSVAVMFITSGLVPWSYALYYWTMTCCGAVFGKTIVDKIVKRTGRGSLLIFILTGTIVFATIGCCVVLLTTLASKDWCLAGFNKLCTGATAGVCPADRFLESVYSTNLF